MSEQKSTIYCGSGKKESETWLKATINIDKIEEHIEEYKGTRFVRLNINIKDAPDQFGKDVSLSVNKWTPPEENAPSEKKPQQSESPEEEEDDLPF